MKSPAEERSPFLPRPELYLYLAPKEDRAFCLKYLSWLQLLAVRAAQQTNGKSQRFNRLYRAVSRTWSEKTLLGALQKEFIDRNISLSLLLEPIDGFNWMAKNTTALPFVKAMPMLLQIISPLSRFVAVINKQRPPFYQPFSTLILIYILLYYPDFSVLSQLLRQCNIVLAASKTEKYAKLLQQEAKEVLSVSEGLKFRIKIAFFVSLSRRLLQKKSQRLVEEKLNFLDYVNIILYGLCYIFTIKPKIGSLNQI